MKLIEPRTKEKPQKKVKTDKQINRNNDKPKLKDMVKTSLYIQPNTWKKICLRAVIEDKQKTEIVNEALTQYLKNVG